jgi:hypothetical protein
LKLYQLFCNNCSWKQLTNGSDVGLVEVKRSPVPGGAPKIDPVTNKVVEPKIKKRVKLFRCPKCGLGITPRIIKDPQAAIDDKKKIEETLKERAEREKEVDERRVVYGKNWLDGDQDSLE